jgi:hypothetical protein
MKNLIRLVTWVSGTWRQIPLFLGMAACTGLFLVARRYGYPIKPLDGYFFGYSPDEVATFLTVTTAEAKSFYRLISGTLDMVYPVVYGLFFAGALARTWGIERWWLWGLAFVAAACDVGENSCVIAILGFAPQSVPESLCRVASKLTVLKWAFVDVALLLTLAGWVKQGIGRFSGRGKSG